MEGDFEGLGLKQTSLCTIYNSELFDLSPVQDQAIKSMILGRDVYCEEVSLTTNSRTYMIALLQLVNSALSQFQAMILVPTKELASVLYNMMLSCDHFLGIKCVLCTGSTSEWAEAIKTGGHVLIGTPGRLLKSILRKLILTDGLKVLILDSADEMILSGCLPTLQELVRTLPINTQRVVFSSVSGSQPVMQSLYQYLRDPVQVLARLPELTLDGVRQFYVNVEQESWKLETVLDLLDTFHISQCVIYCNSRDRVDSLAYQLLQKDLLVSSVHSQMNRRMVLNIVENFQNGESTLLIATDVAPGLYLVGKSVIINYDLPAREAYLERTGQCGCFGRKRSCISFITVGEDTILKDYAQFYCTHIEELPAEAERFL